jgi:DNA-binding MarR family transcriptional regulator
MSQSDATTENHGGRGPSGKIRRAYLSLQRCADAVFSPRGATIDQFAPLWIVRRYDGIRQNELAAELYTDPNTITAMVARLEKRGLLRREVCADDGRARRLHLTSSGRRLIERLSADWEPMRVKLREIFAGEAGEAALRILDQVRETMTQARPDVLDAQLRGSRIGSRGKPAMRSSQDRQAEHGLV